MMSQVWVKRTHYGAVITLLLLIVHCLVWELWWAPLRPGGSFLVLKALPLLLPLRGLIHGRRYTAQWCSLFILFWMAEGAMRMVSDQGLSQGLAFVEFVLATLVFICVSVYARLTRGRR